MSIDYVDGRRYGRAVVAGSDWVLHTRDKLNRLNVFPVPDGDTGTNLALSLAATAAAVRDGAERDLGVVAGSVAEASILGAKGNSGLIFAHWFLGISRAVAEQARVDAHGLAAAFAEATRAVYAAIDKPVEGTVLTVMRAASDGAVAAARQGRNIRELVDDVIVAAEDALARTPDLLPALKIAGVVDAGAQGWVNFMKGVRRALHGEPPPTFAEEDLHGTIAHPTDLDEGELTERYCTELICRGEGFETGALKRLFHDDGSYLLVATTGHVFKLHIHTDHPDRVFAKAQRLGTIVERKVDDMQRQRDERSLARPAVTPKQDQPAWPAIVVDSTADLPEPLRREHGIEMVPLQILFGDRVFRDQIDLTTEQFYAKVAAGETATTSQPPPRAFVEAFDRIREDRDVIVLTLSAVLSGTIKSATSAVGLAPQKRLEIVDSRSASIGIGMMAVGAARLAERGLPTDEILGWIDRWRAATTISFTCDTLEYLYRGGRVTKAQAVIGNFLGLRPILHWDGEQIHKADRARGARDAIRKVLVAATKTLPPGARVRLGLIDAGDPTAAEEAAREFVRRYDVVDTVRGSFTGVIGAHTGPGTWGLVVQRVPDGDPLLASVAP
ncbi:MAG: DegV family protein [bacterium]